MVGDEGGQGGQGSSTDAPERGPVDELDPSETLDDEFLSQRGLTMAELRERWDEERNAQSGSEPGELPSSARPSERDDELLTELPPTDHHLGRFAGWRAARNPRLVVTGALAFALVAATIAFVVHNRELRYAYLHPLPEVEATIAPGTPRDMTLADGQMRVELARVAPAINLLHLPDRDLSLAPGVDKVQFKVEIRGGQTLRLKLLTGEAEDLVETLTAPGAQPLLR